MDKYKKLLVDTWNAIKETNDKDYRYGVDPAGYRKEAHIPYIPDYNPMHVMNLYYPDPYQVEDGPLPVIVYIHGGGYLYGVVDDSERYLGYLASQGFAVMAMNYRLLPYNDMQGIIQDIYASLHWLAAYGPKRGFDLTRVCVNGDSAGGHLTELVTCISMQEELQKIYGVEALPYTIRATALSCPTSEMDKLYLVGGPETESGQGTCKAYMEMFLGEQGEAAPWAEYMSLSEVITKQPLPPLLIIGAESESVHAHTEFLIQTLRKEGQDYETMIWKDEDGLHLQHVFNISHWEWLESIETNQRMLKFFREHVK